MKDKTPKQRVVRLHHHLREDFDAGDEHLLHHFVERRTGPGQTGFLDETRMVVEVEQDGRQLPQIIADALPALWARAPARVVTTFAKRFHGLGRQRHFATRPLERAGNVGEARGQVRADGRPILGASDAGAPVAGGEGGELPKAIGFRHRREEPARTADGDRFPGGNRPNRDDHHFVSSEEPYEREDEQPRQKSEEIPSNLSVTADAKTSISHGDPFHTLYM